MSGIASMKFPVVFDLVTDKVYEGTTLYDLAEREGKRFHSSSERGPEAKTVGMSPTDRAHFGRTSRSE